MDTRHHIVEFAIILLAFLIDLEYFSLIYDININLFLNVFSFLIVIIIKSST